MTKSAAEHADRILRAAGFPPLEVCAEDDAQEAAVLAAVQAAMDDGPQWRTIDSAPRDGTEILLYPAIRRDDTSCTGAWLNTRGGHCWVDLGVGHHNGFWKPTHWRPLPTPPKEPNHD